MHFPQTSCITITRCHHQCSIGSLKMSLQARARLESVTSITRITDQRWSCSRVIQNQRLMALRLRTYASVMRNLSALMARSPCRLPGDCSAKCQWTFTRAQARLNANSAFHRGDYWQVGRCPVEAVDVGRTNPAELVMVCTRRNIVRRHGGPKAAKLDRQVSSGSD